MRTTRQNISCVCKGCLLRKTRDERLVISALHNTRDQLTFWAAEHMSDRCCFQEPLYCRIYAQLKRVFEFELARVPFRMPFPSIFSCADVRALLTCVLTLTDGVLLRYPPEYVLSSSLHDPPRASPDPASDRSLPTSANWDSSWEVVWKWYHELFKAIVGVRRLAFSFYLLSERDLAYPQSEKT